MTIRHEWHIADGFIPTHEAGDSHESICITNTTDDDAHLVITAYFADEEPRTVRGVRVSARRNRHLRTDAPELAELRLRPGQPYGLNVRCTQGLHLQYSRLDDDGSSSTLMTTALLPAASS